MIENSPHLGFQVDHDVFVANLEHLARQHPREGRRVVGVGLVIAMGEVDPQFVAGRQRVPRRVAVGLVALSLGAAETSPEAAITSSFHFLRPAWLIALVPVLLVIVALLGVMFLLSTFLPKRKEREIPPVERVPDVVAGAAMKS